MAGILLLIGAIEIIGRVWGWALGIDGSSVDVLRSLTDVRPVIGFWAQRRCL